MVMAMDKMKFYSTDCGFRKQLRSMKVSNCPVKVVHDLKDLGVYFAAVSQQTAKNYKERFHKCQIRFQKLAVVAWPDNRRAATLMRVILPVVLYGSELTHFSFSTYKQLRGRCSSSLWGARNARDHYLAPLLSASCMYEPFLIVFKRRWKLVQRLLRRRTGCIVRLWNSILQKYAEDPRLLGPFSYFFSQLHCLGWTILPDASVADQQGTSWCLLTDDWSYVQNMVWDAWVQYVVPFVRNSLQYEGLMPFHLSWIRAGYQSGQQYNSLLAKYASGAIMSTEAKSHFLAVSEASCQLCGASGGPVHLLRSCSVTQHVREQGMSAELLQFSCSVGVSGLFLIFRA